jgi:hypothetical protein
MADARPSLDGACAKLGAELESCMDADQRLLELARKRRPDAALEVARSGARVELVVDQRVECAAWSNRCDASVLLEDIVASRHRLGRIVADEEGEEEPSERGLFDALEGVARLSSQLERDRSIVFRRAVAGKHGLVRVEVEIEANLDVHVSASCQNERGELHGGYFEGEVSWLDDQPVTGLLCATARELLARDVEDALAIFKGGLLLATRWTSHRFAAQELEPSWEDSAEPGRA